MAIIEHIHSDQEGRLLAESVLGDAQDAIVIRYTHDGKIFLATTGMTLIQTVGMLEWAKSIMMNNG